MDNKQSLYSDTQVQIDTLRSPSDLLREAIEIFKQRIGVFIGMGLVSMIPSIFSPVMESLFDKLTLGIISSIFVLLLNRFILFWYFAALLCLVSERSMGVKDSFQKALYKVWPLFLTGVLTFIITTLGYLFLIIPGIIFSIQFQFVPFVVVIDRLKGRAALSKSKDLVGDRWLQIMWRSSFILFILISTYFIFGLFGIKIISKIVNALVPQIVIIYYFLLYENLKEQTPEPKNDSIPVGPEIKDNFPRRKKVFPSSLVLLIIFALVIGFLIKTGVVHRIIETYIPFPEQNIEIEEEDKKIDLTAGWKIYRSEEGKFELEYPASWKIREAFNIGGISYRPGANRVRFLEKGIDLKIEYWTKLGEQYSSFEDYTENMKYLWTNTATGGSVREVFGVKEEDIILDDISAKKLSIANSTKFGRFQIIYVFAQYKGIMYAISAETPSDADNLNQNILIFNQMISTFKFFEIDVTAGWQFHRNEDYGFGMNYPTGFDKKYISEYSWPPTITVRSFDPNFFCENLDDVKTSVGYGKQEEVVFNGSKYCVLITSDYAAGTKYSHYRYVVKKDDKHLTLEFVLRFPSCGALYDIIDNKMEECDKEHDDFDPINIVDQIISTLKLKVIKYELRYPKDFIIEENERGVRIHFPESYKNKSYIYNNDVESAWIDVGMMIMDKIGFSGNDWCQKMDELNDKDVIINNLNFIKGNIQEHAMGGRYTDYVVYRTKHMGNCYEIVLAVMGDGPGAGSNDGRGPLPEDYANPDNKNDFYLILEQIVSSFKFVEHQGTECERWLKECAKEEEGQCGPCGCRNCCSGLVSRDVTHPYRNENNEVVCLENMTAYICVKCGDGICSKKEDWCICSEDCQKPNLEDLEFSNR